MEAFAVFRAVFSGGAGSAGAAEAGLIMTLPCLCLISLFGAIP